MSLDPVVTNPDHYAVIFENDRVRVLVYKDPPGDETTPHEHPDSVMYTLSSFRRRLHSSGGANREVELPAGLTGWLPAQQHSGHNIGDTDTHVIFVELKDAVANTAPDASGRPEPAEQGSQAAAASLSLARIGGRSWGCGGRLSVYSAHCCSDAEVRRSRHDQALCRRPCRAARQEWKPHC